MNYVCVCFGSFSFGVKCLMVAVGLCGLPTLCEVKQEQLFKGSLDPISR